MYLKYIKMMKEIGKTFRSFFERFRMPKKRSQSPTLTPKPPHTEEILKGENERTKAEYLESLNSADRTHVEELLRYFESRVQTKLPDLGLAVLAVGSTVKPPESRDHLPRNVNLKVLTAIPPTTPQNQVLRAVIAGEILHEIERFANEKGLENYPDDKNTAYLEWGKGIGSSSEESVAYSNWEYGNPSILIRYQEGLMAQVSITGDRADDKITHLRKERSSNNYFAILYPTPQSL